MIFVLCKIAQPQMHHSLIVVDKDSADQLIDGDY